MVVSPTMPLPPSVPPAFTVMVELAKAPFTRTCRRLWSRACRRIRSGQRPSRSADFIEGREALILRGGTNVDYIETAPCRVLPSWNISAPVPNTLPVIDEPGEHFQYVCCCRQTSIAAPAISVITPPFSTLDRGRAEEPDGAKSAARNRSGIDDGIGRRAHRANG